MTACSLHIAGSLPLIRLCFAGCFPIDDARVEKAFSARMRIRLFYLVLEFSVQWIRRRNSGECGVPWGRRFLTRHAWVALVRRWRRLFALAVLPCHCSLDKKIQGLALHWRRGKEPPRYLSTRERAKNWTCTLTMFLLYSAESFFIPF